ncbi:hypothetical protein LSAT2_016833 [Lamellibrachia satsuma]|nr:hypothetical protein LSAT2_016833 [Lamellibrachia satsuma]
MTIYAFSENLDKAFPKVFVPENITAGLRATSIHPVDRDIFHDDEFLSAYVTERSAELTNEEVEPVAENPDAMMPQKDVLRIQRQACQAYPTEPHKRTC